MNEDDEKGGIENNGIRMGEGPNYSN